MLTKKIILFNHFDCCFVDGGSTDACSTWAVGIREQKAIACVLDSDDWVLNSLAKSITPLRLEAGGVPHEAHLHWI